jgi:Fe-S-cluster containining protein
MTDNAEQAALVLRPLASSQRLTQVDTSIFTLRYFAHCMSCTFCGDACCNYGADVDVGERDRILENATSLARYVSAPAEEWFTTTVNEDPDYASGKFVRTRVQDGACVFKNPAGRGCQLHAWALAERVDYHQIKPTVCWLFPVIWDRGVLRPSSDVRDGLVCAGQGVTLYRAARGELQVLFGASLIEELDALEARLSD